MIIACNKIIFVRILTLIILKKHLSTQTEIIIKFVFLITYLKKL